MRKRLMFLSADGQTTIKGYLWIPEQGKPKAVLQLTHGMVEYIRRYEEFAQYLNQQGYLVAGMDLLGHGESVTEDSRHGFFAEKRGDQILAKDMHTLHQRVHKEYPELPYFILGHSMGSFLVRRYLILTGGKGINGVIIMGTGSKPYALSFFGIVLTQVIKKIKGSMYRSKWVDDLAFGAYNRAFEPARTKQDWLSRDEAQVDAYRNHPWCNFMFTVSAYQDLFRVLCFIAKKSNQKRMEKALPILLVSGEADPVGDHGKGVRKVYEQYVEMGMEDVTLKLYPKDRHEILNELDRQQIYKDLYYWMEKRK